MVFNTISVSTAIGPTVIETYFSHYLNRKQLHQKPTAHISYHEGLNLIRHFLTYASRHTVEDIQRFTSQWVPVPRWIKVEEVDIPEQAISKAVDAICAQLGHKGIDKVGGRQWWQWRRDGSKLQAEWVEMRRDHNKHKLAGVKSKRVMLYVHGGAYFFGSVDEHRYQLQRHARKLEARVFARMMIILRDQKLPLPAGAILISPWCDLTHSFPSVAGDSSSDYIPAHGFMQRPSAAWPPPNADDIKALALSAIERVAEEALPRKSSQLEREHAAEHAIEGLSERVIDQHLKPSAKHAQSTASGESPVPKDDPVPGTGHHLSITLNGKLVEIKDQIQMYTTNQLISHPLVSPVLQPSLGGLPPLLILTGGGEVLRDEQIYLAHKAANPSKYPPGDVHLDEYPGSRDLVTKYAGTDVQLQVWDDLCHVAPTLSFTRPAKFMYRSVAQFGAWALAKAQRTEIDIQDDDDMSIISSGSDSEAEESETAKSSKGQPAVQTSDNSRIGKAGEPLPRFKHHMIRQRVDRNGNVRTLEAEATLAALQLAPSEIGSIKVGPVSKWLQAKAEWDNKYAREKRRVQSQRAKELAAGYETFGNDEVPPPSALAGRRRVGLEKEEKKSRSWGMSIWSLWGSSHDEQTMEREEKAEQANETSSPRAEEDSKAGIASGLAVRADQRSRSRSASRRRVVMDAGQSNEVDENTPAAVFINRRQASEPPDTPDVLTPEEDWPMSPPGPMLQVNGEDIGDGILKNTTNRPVAGPGKAFPFKLASDHPANASTVTLESHAGVLQEEASMEVRDRKQAV